MTISLLRHRALQIFHTTRLYYLDYHAGLDLQLIQNNLEQVYERDILLVCCLRNEKSRIPFFYDYYKSMGVAHFIFVNNDSSDSFSEWASGKKDVSVFYTGASYKDARFGVLWCNDLLRRYGCGHWCVVVDPDEFLVYPFVESRNLRALTQFLDEQDRHCMHTIMLDAYSRDAPCRTILGEGDDPFEICPYFDRDGYVQEEGWGGGIDIKGGPRQRRFFAGNPDDAPSLNKIPLIKWRRDFHYNMSTHNLWPTFLNNPQAGGDLSVTGALFHFKMVALLGEKVSEEMTRREHFANGMEYQRYHGSLDKELYANGISVRYRGSSQLVELGLMSPGCWF